MIRSQELKFEPPLIPLLLGEDVRHPQKTATWRYDPAHTKELQIGTLLNLSGNSGWHEEPVGVAVPAQVIRKPLQEFSVADMAGHETYETTEQMLETFRGYYGSEFGPASEIVAVQFDLASTVRTSFTEEGERNITIVGDLFEVDFEERMA